MEKNLTVFTRKSSKISVSTSANVPPSVSLHVAKLPAKVSVCRPNQDTQRPETMDPKDFTLLKTYPKFRNLYYDEDLKEIESKERTYNYIMSEISGMLQNEYYDLEYANKVIIPELNAKIIELRLERYGNLENSAPALNRKGNETILPCPAHVKVHSNGQIQNIKSFKLKKKKQKIVTSMALMPVTLRNRK